MILVGVMRLKVIILEPNPLLGGVSICPLHIIENISRLAKSTSAPYTTMVASFELDAVTEVCVLDDECCLIWERNITLSIRRTGNVSAAAILEVLCLFPAEIVKIYKRKCQYAYIDGC